MFKINIKNLFVFIVVSMMAISCDDDDNPVVDPPLEGLQVSGFDESVAIVEVHSHDHEEEEEEEEHTEAEGFILENEDGDEEYRQFQGAVTGSISIAKDATLELVVHFLDSSGEEIVHEDEDHAMEIEITGVGVGTTTFSMELWHDGHVDWSSTNLIEITVTE